jgi:hypothetical protein
VGAKPPRPLLSYPRGRYIFFIVSFLNFALYLSVQTNSRTTEYVLMKFDTDEIY